MQQADRLQVQQRETLLSTLSSHKVAVPRNAPCTGPGLQLMTTVQAFCPQDQDECCPESLKPTHVPMAQGFSFSLPTLEKLVSGLVGPPTPAVCPSLLLKPRRWLTTQVILKSKAS